MTGNGKATDKKKLHIYTVFFLVKLFLMECKLILKLRVTGVEQRSKRTREPGFLLLDLEMDLERKARTHPVGQGD